MPKPVQPASLLRVPTAPQDLARINAMVKHLETLVCNLAARWLDEHEYEDIQDYQARIETSLPEGFTITKMTKRPFGFQFTIGTSAVYALYCSTTAYGWKRVS